MKNTIFLLLITSIAIISCEQKQENIAYIDATQSKYRINKLIYSHFSEHLGHCIYEGIWVGEGSTILNKNGIRTDVVDALKQIQIPSLRWPGGCFADEYHWKDGIGPKNQRPSMINTNWGGITEDNSFGTHEFLELCSQLGCEPYISGNLGSGTVQELSQWVEYINSANVSPMTDLRKKNGRENPWSVSFWGIGNESWGCGGSMKPDYYSDLARRYSTYLKNYNGSNLKKILVGPSDGDYNWTETVMSEAGSGFWGLSLHSYTWANGKTATDFDESGWFDVLNKTCRMEEYVTNHSAIMDKYDPSKSIALVVDEWGTWYAVEPGTNPGFLYQQNTLRDALVAGINLNIFNNHCDRVKMAAIAQVVNVLQSVILTDKDKMVLTPTYHVFDMYKVHQNALMVPVKLNCENYTFINTSIPSLNMSASIDNAGNMNITICNLNHSKNIPLTCNLSGYKAVNVSGQIITAEKLNAHNTFDSPNDVHIDNFSNYKINTNNIEVNMPAHSVVLLSVEGKLDIPDKTAKLVNPVQGLNYNLYKGNWNMLPDFSKLEPIEKGIINKFDLSPSFPDLNYGLEYNGYIKIPKNGFYEFSMVSDDGTLLFIDDDLVVSNNGLHAMIEQQGSVFLQQGYHKIELQFFQAGGGAGIEVYIQGPGINKQPVDASLLWSEK